MENRRQSGVRPYEGRKWFKPHGLPSLAVTWVCGLLAGPLVAAGRSLLNARPGSTRTCTGAFTWPTHVWDRCSYSTATVSSYVFCSVAPIRLLSSNPRLWLFPTTWGAQHYRSSPAQSCRAEPGRGVRPRVGGLDGRAEPHRPTALSLDFERIFVLDSVKHRVQVFSPGGVLLQSLAWDRVRKPSAFAFDPQSRLFFVGDPLFKAVRVFDEQGAPVSAFGKAGSALDEFYTPTNLYVDSEQRIYVTDSTYGKVLVISTEPRGTSPSPRIGTLVAGATVCSIAASL